MSDFYLLTRAAYTKLSRPLARGALRIGLTPDIVTVTDAGRDEAQACSQPVSATVSARQVATIAVVCIVP